jgi:hypothetical protein
MSEMRIADPAHWPRLVRVSTQDQDRSATKGKALFENLVYPEGEIPVSVQSVDNIRKKGIANFDQSYPTHATRR